MSEKCKNWLFVAAELERSLRFFKGFRKAHNIYDISAHADARGMTISDLSGEATTPKRTQEAARRVAVAARNCRDLAISNVDQSAKNCRGEHLLEEAEE